MTLTTVVDIRAGCLANMANFARDLLREHWEEIARHKDLLVLNPDWDTYAKLAEIDRLLILEAWAGDELVGYSVNIVVPHLHYRDVLVCQNDVLFVSMAHRATRTGIRLMRETEVEAKRRGCKLVLWHAKKDSSLDHMLGRERSAYSVQDIVYGRKL